MPPPVCFECEFFCWQFLHIAPLNSILFAWCQKQNELSPGTFHTDCTFYNIILLRPNNLLFYCLSIRCISIRILGKMSNRVFLSSTFSLSSSDSNTISRIFNSNPQNWNKLRKKHRNTLMDKKFKFQALIRLSLATKSS